MPSVMKVIAPASARISSPAASVTTTACMSSPMISWVIMGRLYMRYRTFGRTGWQVSEIGYGMWGMGGWTGSDDEESLRALDRALALGCNFFDTAWAYGQGKSERLLGEALRSAKASTGEPDRPRPIVATKIPP